MKTSPAQEKPIDETVLAEDDHDLELYDETHTGDGDSTADSATVSSALRTEGRKRRPRRGKGHRETAESRRGRRMAALLAFGILPIGALGLAGAAAYFKWCHATERASQVAGVESVEAARDIAMAMLSYTPDTAEKDLTAARDGLTGAFRDDYTELVNDVVIPGAKQQKVSSLAAVQAAAPMSTQPGHAVVLLYVNQNVTVGNEAPTDTASTVKVTLDKVGDRWLVSAFEPI